MIQTFVFFDVETTGLIRGEEVPKITELSMIAVARDAILNPTEDLPRVLHKLILPIHPNIQIPNKITLLTNLSTQNLESVKTFDHGVHDIIVSFIARLSEPVCFVAHNGCAFDYPILLREIDRINKVIDEDILCIDTLHLFKEFYMDPANQVIGNTSTIHTSVQCSHKEFSTLLNDGYDDVLLHALDSVLQDDSNKSRNDLEQSTPSNQKTSASIRCSPKSTFKNKHKPSTPPKHSYRTMQEINEKTPESQVIKLQTVDTRNQKEKSAKKKLDFSYMKPHDYKLSTVYKHMFGLHPENTHRAEGDCLIMLCCAHKIGDYFIQWADNNAMPLIAYRRK